MKRLARKILQLPIFDIDWWQEIWITVSKNKSRSLLTAFGMFWAMFMLVVMMGAGLALQNGIMSEIKGFATNSCFVYTSTTSESYKGFRKGRHWDILSEDIPILQQKIAELDQIAPVIFDWQSKNNVVFGDKSGSYNLKGSLPSYNKIDESKLIYGRYINDIDILQRRKVCLIGERVYQELIGKGKDPQGMSIRIKGVYFRIIGVMRSLGGNIQIGGPSDETIILPFSTMQQVFNMGNEIHLIAATAKPDVKVKVLEKKIKDELRRIHSISPTDEKAVASINFEEQFIMFRYLGLGIAWLIAVVGIGTMLAGGIGISNIMLVTVRERTKEIGIRRALGATPANIIVQIMSESMLLTLLAGVLGLVLGVGLLRVVESILSRSEQFFKEPQISFGLAMLSLFVLLIIATISGYLPARRAMEIKPIEAIREE